jgi:hypothetical protein
MQPSMLAGRRRLPVGLSQAVDGLEEYRTVREQHRARLRRCVLRPFQAGVAHVDGEKAHAE